MRFLRLILIAAALQVLAGCATSIAYRADYLPDRAVADTDRVQGRVLIYTTRETDERLVTAGATSFTGSGASLTAPVGMVTREVAVKVFARHATGGAVASNELADAARYDLIVRPETQDFRYGFPQLKNLGFAITPEVQLTLRVQLVDSTGRPLLEQTYQSGVVEGKSYMMSGSPYERINRLLHETMFELMLRAVADVRAHQQSNRPATAPPPAASGN